MMPVQCQYVTVRSFQHRISAISVWLPGQAASQARKKVKKVLEYLRNY
jgi:mevalonate pyrophosphate decarboxylase